MSWDFLYKLSTANNNPPLLHLHARHCHEPNPKRPPPPTCFFMYSSDNFNSITFSCSSTSDWPASIKSLTFCCYKKHASLFMSYNCVPQNTNNGGIESSIEDNNCPSMLPYFINAYKTLDKRDSFELLTDFKPPRYLRTNRFLLNASMSTKRTV